MGNYVNAIDGRGKTAGDSERMAEFKQIELEPSMSVSPKQGIPGDSVNVQLHDFQTYDVVTKIEFARTVDICDDDAMTDRYTDLRLDWSQGSSGRQWEPELQLYDSQQRDPRRPGPEDSHHQW